MDEIWKDIEGYEGLYQVSNKGRIKSFYGGREKILRTTTKGNVYCKILLSKNGTSKNVLVHRIVQKCLFQILKTNLMSITLMATKNNCIENLEWVTGSENTKHAFDTELAKVLNGSKNGAAKLTSKHIQEIRATFKRGDKIFWVSALARKFKVDTSTI